MARSTTRYRSELPAITRFAIVPRAIGLAAALALNACASSGAPSAGIASKEVAEAFLPLSRWNLELRGFTSRHGAALVVAPRVAVTNAHNANLLPPDLVLAQSDYDLLFFRTDKVTPPAFASPAGRQSVIAYGEGGYGELREAKGTVRMLDDPVMPRCTDCRVQPSFSFEADGGPGFSGGPLVDADSGAVVGIVFGFCDGVGVCGAKRMFAFDMAVVLREMHRLLDAPGR
jgi:hypothetical protein